EPGKAEPTDIVFVDPGERAETLLPPVATVAQPVADLRRRIDIAHRRSVDKRGYVLRFGRRRRRRAVDRGLTCRQPREGGQCGKKSVKLSTGHCGHPLSDGLMRQS